MCVWTSLCPVLNKCEMMQLRAPRRARLLQYHLPSPRHRRTLAASWVPQVRQVWSSNERSTPGLNPGSTRPEAEAPSSG
jgi:hypothetical protein